MDRRDHLLRLVQDLLAAPGATQGFVDFLRHLCEALDASAANFIGHDFAAGQAGVAVAARTDPDALVVYQQHWHLEDPWAHNEAVVRLRVGDVVVGDQLIDRRRFDRTAFFNDFGHRYGIAQCLAGMIDIDRQGLTCISLNAGEERHRFSSEDAAFLSTLMPHLRLAVDLHRRLRGAELLVTSLSAVLDRFPHAVILISASGRVVAMNDRAGKVLERRDGLSLDRGQLRAANPEVTGRLSQLLARAGAAGSGQSLQTGGEIVLPRPSGGRALLGLVSPLPRVRDHFERQPAVCVLFLTDPEERLAVPSSIVQRLFDLTPAESVLAKHLIEGKSLEECASSLGLSVQTVRSRLKAIFQKTGTHRQAELVALMLKTLLPSFE